VHAAETGRQRDHQPAAFAKVERGNARPVDGVQLVETETRDGPGRRSRRLGRSGRGPVVAYVMNTMATNLGRRPSASG